MTLRVRLALTLLVLVVPFAVGIVALQNHWARRTTAEAMAESLRDRGDEALFRCERDPATWPRRFGRRRGPRPHGPAGGRPFAYDREGRSANPNAPELAEGFVAEAAREGMAWELTPNGSLRVGTLIADSGPCALLVVQRPAQLLRTPLWPALLRSALPLSIGS